MADVIANPAAAAGGKVWTADRRLWLTVDGKVVEDGHPDARTLLCAPGQTIPYDQAERLGLVTGGKGRKKPAKDKAVKRPARDKGGGD